MMKEITSAMVRQYRDKINVREYLKPEMGAVFLHFGNVANGQRVKQNNDGGCRVFCLRWSRRRAGYAVSLRDACGKETRSD